MRIRSLLTASALALVASGALSQNVLAAPFPQAQDNGVDPTQTLVDRLTLDDYKTTLKGLTQFGDRRQGTERNRNAVDWIEARTDRMQRARMLRQLRRGDSTDEVLWQAVGLNTAGLESALRVEIQSEFTP